MSSASIVIAGFGRSGTTWLSDIISKSLGGLILFEPFHPCVFQQSREYCYASNWEDVSVVPAYLKTISREAPKNLWLLRNHLNQPLDQVSDSFVSYIWKNSKVLGFKTIRANHFLHELYSNIGARIILIHRHPLSVLCSIINRKNFWNEYGWEWHLANFFSKSLVDKHFNPDQLVALRKMKNNASTKEDLIVLMWGVSFIISIRQVSACKGFALSYEDLYLDPYQQIKAIFNFLKLENTSIHPSHLFVPSLTTLNTVHTKRGVQDLTLSSLDNLFWKNQLKPTLALSLLEKLELVLNVASDVKEYAQECNYLQDSLVL